MEESPKSLEELNKVLEEKEQERVKDYNKSKWSAAGSLFGNPYQVFRSYGIFAYPDLIKKDRKFWNKVGFLLLIAALLAGIAIYLNVNSFYLLIVPVTFLFLIMSIQGNLVTTIITSIISAAATLLIFSIIISDFSFPQSFHSKTDTISWRALALLLVYALFLRLFTKLLMKFKLFISHKKL